MTTTRYHRTFRRLGLIFVLGAMIVGGTTTAVAEGSVEKILERFAADYRHDPMLTADVTFGVEVDGEMWHVVARAATEAAEAKVDLGAGAPAEPTFYYSLDRATLGKLDRGELNPGTAMVKAFSTDPSPMEVEEMEGFAQEEGFLETLLRTTFHFWVRGFPEVVPFGPEHTRFTHGADAVVLYYQPGFRSGWFRIEPGQHANEDPRSQTNPFPSLFVVTRGKGTARIGGEEIDLHEGQSLFIPPEVTHEFWNDGDEPWEGVLLMFGDGA